jgi:hypothetical protein
LGTLYCRQRGLSAVERVTLCRSVGRLVANEMIAVEGRTRRHRKWLQLTAKGRAWLQAHEAALEATVRKSKRKK